jgi:hypothetical protein
VILDTGRWLLVSGSWLLARFWDLLKQYFALFSENALQSVIDRRQIRNQTLCSPEP